MGGGMEPAASPVTRVTRFAIKWWLKRRANFALMFNRTPQAIVALRDMLRVDRADIYARSVLGNLYARTGDRSSAISEFRALVAIHPDHAETWFNLGFLHDQHDELEDAERCFRRAVALTPSLDRAWYGLGLVLIRQGRLQEAIVTLQRNIKLQPFSPYGYYQLGMTYHHLGRRVEAWKMYEQLVQFEPKYAATLKRDLEGTKPQAVSTDSKPAEATSAETL